MDYIQEDIDSMLKELEIWQKESIQHKEALQREQKYVLAIDMVACCQGHQET